MTTLDFKPASVFVATGGARGITAQCVIRLAQTYQGRWILLGRSAIAPAEPPWATDCLDEAVLKRRIMEHFQAQGLKPTPKDIQAEFQKISTRREILATLSAIEAAGGEAAYLSVDVTDRGLLRTQLEDLVDRWGPISGILHGAGNLADKRIEKKTLADYEAVYAAKVTGLENLLRCIPAEQLHYLVLFSSVTGFYGNAGQTDYAIANEILNKSAHRLKQQHPDCHVVAINWGPWEGGMVTPELKKIYAEHNVQVIPVAAGTQLLAAELHPHNQAIAQVVVGNPLPEPRQPLDPTLRSHRIHRKLTLADNPFLLDHQIAGYPVLPATCAMAWMINLCEQFYPSYQFFSCDHFKILKGIVFDETLSPTYVLDLEERVKQEDDKIEIAAKIWSKTQAGKTHYHYTSQLQLSRRLPDLPAFADIELRPDHPLTGTDPDFYGTQATDLFHGSAFQGIDQIIHIDQAGITAQATWQSISAACQGQFPIQTVNPFIADLSMHALWIWTQHYHQKACLPAEVERFEQFAPIPPDQPFLISTQVTGLTASSVTANFVVQDQTGLVYTRMTGAKATLLDMNWLRKKS